MRRRSRAKSLYIYEINIITRKLYKSALPTAVIIILSCVLIYILISHYEELKIPVENVMAFRVNYTDMKKIESFANKHDMDFSEMLTYYSLENEFFEEKKEPEQYIYEKFLSRYEVIKKKYRNKNIKPYYKILNNIINEIKCFPVATDDKETEYIFGDSWGALRVYGGKRIHMGTDIIDRENIRGRLNVVSMTDGIVERIGWNEKGGWRVGIRSYNGNYYYYAHLNSFSSKLTLNQKIKAGDLIGFMGDSGYGKEGTYGKFEVHLHVGILVNTTLYKEELWINPYPFLRLFEKA